MIATSIKAVALVATVAVAIGYPVLYRSTYDTVDACVTKSIAKQLPGEEAQTYLIGTTHGDGEETFRVSDSWLFLKFTTGDQFMMLTEGECFRLGVAGWRVPFFSSYRNIIDIDRRE